VAPSRPAFVGRMSRGSIAARTSVSGMPVPAPVLPALLPPAPVLPALTIPASESQAPPTPESLFSENYAHLVRSLAVAFGDSEAAADAVQAAFIQLCLRWKRVTGHHDPVAWVRRLAVSQLRSRNGHNGHRAAPLLRAARRKTQDNSKPAFRADLEAALARLPLPERVAVALHYMEDLPLSEVARSMDISEKDAGTYLQDARQALAPNLKPEPWPEKIFY
jgi:RNA polymerase sigma-70 factor (ECF subfamily)